MVAIVLNPGPVDAVTQALLSEHLHSFSDVDVIAGHVSFPSHRAVLSVHSHDFRHLFSSPDLLSVPSGKVSDFDSPPPPPTSSPARAVPPPTSGRDGLAPPRFRVHIAVDDMPDPQVLAGWHLIHAYMYGASVPLSTDAALAALPICRRYRFDELGAALDAYLADGAVDPANCTRVFAAAATVAATPAARTRQADSQLVQGAAWAVMKIRFEEVQGWENVPYPALVRLLKLNDLHVSSEKKVFDSVASWVRGNGPAEDDVVAGLVKLVRFPTMTEEELDAAASDPLVAEFPVCRKYLSRGFAARADEKRGLVRSVVMESSPVYRRRRTDALTFSDRVTGWSRVERSVQTSSRYFAGGLWNLVLEADEEWVGLHLGCLAENDEREMDVELDFSLFVVRHGGGDEPELVSKEVKGAGFGRSGLRIGFEKMIRRDEVDKEGSRLLLRDTLFIGASLRLRCSKADVIGITVDGDDTAESVSRMS